MKNCLIVGDNNANIINLINFFACKKLDIKILGITQDVEKSINIIEKNKVDFIIIDFSRGSFNLKDLLFELEKRNLVKQKRSIIVLNDDAELKEELKSNLYISDYFIKPILLKELYTTILRKCKLYNSKELYKDILDELYKLSFGSKYIGTQYISECIYEVFISGKKYDYSLFNDILPILSKKYSKSVDSIYGDMKQSIKRMMKTCDQAVIIDYFKFCEFEKPKPKQIIDRVMENI